MFLIKYIILLASCFLAEIDSEATTPTFIWGTKLLQAPNVFQVVSSKKFANMLGPLQQEHMIIVYFSPMLSTKDFSCLNEDCYPFLHEVEPSCFFSRVRQPWNALQRISQVNGQPVIWNSMEEMLNLPCDSRIYAFNFSNLKTCEHEHFMSAVARKLSSCPVIHVYTAYGSPAQELRLPRSDESIPETTISSNNKTKQKLPKIYTILRHAQGLIVVDRIMYAQEARRGANIYYKRWQIQLDRSHSTLSFELINSNDILKGCMITMETSMGPMEITVWPIMGNWRIASIQFGNNSYRPRDLLFYSRKFSFCCNVLSVYSNDGGRLSLYSFFMDVVLLKNYSALDHDYIPKKCWLCEEYLTPGINQLMFTMLILLILLSCGIYMILNMGVSERLASPNDPDMQTKGGTTN